MLNPFVENVPILYPLKICQNVISIKLQSNFIEITLCRGRFSVIFTEYKMGTLARNELKSSRDYSVLTKLWRFLEIFYCKNYLKNLWTHLTKWLSKYGWHCDHECITSIITYEIPVKWKWQNRHFWYFFKYKFLCVRVVDNTNKKIWWGQIDWQLKLELFSLIWWLSVALQTVW